MPPPSRPGGLQIQHRRESLLQQKRQTPLATNTSTIAPDTPSKTQTRLPLDPLLEKSQKKNTSYSVQKMSGKIDWNMAARSTYRALRQYSGTVP